MTDRVPSSAYSKEAVLKREAEEAARCHASSNRVQCDVCDEQMAHGLHYRCDCDCHAIPNSAATRCPNCGEPIKFEGEHWEQGGYFCRATPNRVQYALIDSADDRIQMVSYDRSELECVRPEWAYPDRLRIWCRSVGEWEVLEDV